MKANDKIRQKIILNLFKLTFLKQNNISCPSSCPKMKMTQFTTHRHKEYSRLFILDRHHNQDISRVSARKSIRNKKSKSECGRFFGN